MAGVPLWMNAKQARAGIPDTDWHGVGMGERKFRRLVHAGVIPCWTDPDTGTRHFSRLALEAWALRNGVAA
jgi:hypothetical protein